jgi:hypothetical protein
MTTLAPDQASASSGPLKIAQRFNAGNRDYKTFKSFQGRHNRSQQKAVLSSLKGLRSCRRRKPSVKTLGYFQEKATLNTVTQLKAAVGRPLSMVGWPEQVNQLHSTKNGYRPAHHAEQNIQRRDMYQSAAQEKQSLIAEGRKSRETPKDAGEEKQAQGGRKEVMMFHQGPEDANHQAAEEVNAQGAQRELPRLGVMQDQATEFVTGGRTNSASKRNDSNLFYSKHRTDSCFIAGVISLLGSSSSREERQTPLPGRTIAETTHPATLLPILF